MPDDQLRKPLKLNSAVPPEPFHPLEYVWLEHPTEEELSALRKAEELLRKVDQQILRIDSSGALRNRIDRFSKSNKIVISDSDEYIEAIERQQFNEKSKITSAIDINRNNFRSIMNLMMSRAFIFSYIDNYLTKMSNPKSLHDSLSSLEAHTVDNALRFRLHAMMQIYLSAIAIFIVIFASIAVLIEQNIYNEYTITIPSYSSEPLDGQFNSEDSEAAEKFLESLVQNLSIKKINYLPSVDTFLYLAIGVFAGRFLFIFISKPNGRENFENFYNVERQFETPITDIFADSFVAFSATVLFLSGIIVFGVGDFSGETERLISDLSDKGNLSPKGKAVNTSNLSGNWDITMGFGILIGLARQQFIGRIGSVANSTVS